MDVWIGQIRQAEQVWLVIKFRLDRVQQVKKKLDIIKKKFTLVNQSAMKLHLT